MDWKRGRNDLFFLFTTFTQYTSVSSFPNLISRSLPLQGQIWARDRVECKRRQKSGRKKGLTWLTLLCSGFILSASDFLLRAFSWVLWRPRVGALMPFMPSTRWILHHAFNLILTTATNCPQFSFSLWIGSKTVTLVLSHESWPHTVCYGLTSAPSPHSIYTLRS